MTTLLATMMLLATGFVFSACSNDDTTPTPNNAPDSEIHFTPEVWKMLEGTRATFYDTGTPLTSGSFTCYAFNANSTTAYINQTTVNYTAGQWTFEDGKHYWPAEGNLDFFAYMPAIAPTYITAGPSYTAARNPQFTCGSLPMTNAGQNDLQEFVYALVTDQNKAGQGSTGVTLTFQHPFSRIDMKLSSAQAKPVTINTITFKTLKNNGTYTHNGSPNKWVLTGNATDFKVTLDQDFAVTGNEQTIGTSYLMIPQNWTGNIEVEATWDDWGVSLKHTISTKIDAVDWAPGTCYTYTFTITETDLIVNSAKYTEQW